MRFPFCSERLQFAVCLSCLSVYPSLHSSTCPSVCLSRLLSADPHVHVPHPSVCLSAPGWTPWQVARRAGFVLFGVLNGTEANPNFLQEVEELADLSNGAVLVSNGALGTIFLLFLGTMAHSAIVSPLNAGGEDAG
jgi:hypothetical protein